MVVVREDRWINGEKGGGVCMVEGRSVPSPVLVGTHRQQVVVVVIMVVVVAVVLVLYVETRRVESSRDYPDLPDLPDFLTLTIHLGSQEVKSQSQPVEVPRFTASHGPASFPKKKPTRVDPIRAARREKA